MKFELVRFGDHFRLVKGASYSSKNLVEESDTGLLTINAFLAGGGYKPQSEKPFHGDVRAEHLLSNGDVLIAMTEQDEGLLGSPLVVHKGRTDYEDLLFSLDVAKPVATTGEIEPEFVFNVLRIPAFRKRAAYGDTGSTVQRLPYDAIGDLKIPKPPLPTQRAINRLAAAIDKKIWLNSRMADNLEKLSESVFKSWFIDFDPVKAKMAGQAPVGMDSETAALFPDSMEDSEIGEIPSGWELRSLAEVVSVTKGRSYKSSELEESSVSLVTLKSFFRGGGYRKDGLKPFTGTFKDDQVVKPGELVMAFTDVTQAAELIGVPAIVEADPTAELLVASLDLGIVRPLASSVPNLFIYFHLKSDSFREHAKSHASGTTVLHLSKDAIPNFKLAMPPAELLQKFREIAEPAFSLMDSLSQQSRMLSETRDSLLPRLISGELEIPDEMLAA